MTLRNAYAVMFAALALLALWVLVGGQRPAFADQVTPVPVNPCEDVFPHIPNMPGCGEDGDDESEIENPPVNPCDDIFPHIPNMPECDDDGGNGGGEEPIDVCPNIEGDQASVPEGKVLENGQCVDAPSNGGGGNNNGGGGSSGGGGGGGGGGTVLGTTTAAACEQYISTFMRRGQVNDPEQVKRVQGILKMFEGADLEETGEYDEKSEAAIKAFQLKYADEVLTPWGIQQPTGYVFLTTRKKLNEVYCKNTVAFPLTAEEQGHIELVKRGTVVKPAAPAAAAPARAPQQAEAPKVETATTAPESTDAETPVRGNRIKDFFRRLFDRFR
jgi:hypothetical protein